MKDKKHGKQEGYDLAHIRVQICQTAKGLLTHHHPETDEDYDILRSWNSGGMEQVANALLNEAVKREIYLAVFSDMSQEQELEIDPIKDRVYTVIHKLILKGIEDMTPMIVEVFQKEQVKNQ